MKVVTKLSGYLPRSWIKLISRAQWKHPLLKRIFDFGADQFRNQDGVVQQGEGKGLRFNVGQSNAGYLLGTAEPSVQFALRTLIQSGMTVYDVGANVGFLSLIIARHVGLSGGVICFEPLPDNSRQIEHNIHLNNFENIVVRREALGDENGEAVFLVSSESTWGKLESVGSPVDKQVGEIKVQVRMLDDLIALKEMPPPDLLKIDVEGAEVAVLKGALECIKVSRPILLIELHGTNERISVELNEMNYISVVLGTTDSIIDAPWDAYVAAIPVERSDLIPAIESLKYLTELR